MARPNQPISPRRRALLVLVLLAVDGIKSADAQSQGPAPKPPIRATEVLEKAWPGHPEWAAMLADILQGSQLGPGEGWFKKGVAATRYTWDAVRSRLDKDGDGAIRRDEFAGSDADFNRLDRDRDRALTAADLDFSPHALAPSPGVSLFYAADRDGDGRVTAEEFQGVFRALDAGGMGFLSQDDLRRAFAPPPTSTRPPSVAAKAASSGPSRWTLVKGLFRQEIGSLQAGPKVEEPAPDFTLKTAEGEAVTLSKLVGPKPVVLVFGNFTCGPFRGQAGNVEKLSRRYRDRATFVMVYVREAHPVDGWHMASNDQAGVSIRQPRSYVERVEVARTCGKALDFGFPMLVDTLDDAVGARYSGMPARLYLIDRDGKVAFKSGRGPFGFKPSELEASLLLQLEQAGRDQPRPAPDPSQPAS